MSYYGRASERVGGYSSREEFFAKGSDPRRERPVDSYRRDDRRDRSRERGGGDRDRYGGGGRRYRDRDNGGPKGGAEHLARIHGTEEDKVNCPFYFKIGACRHGERCSRKHNKPPFSQTILLQHMYKNPASQHHQPPARGERSAPQGANDTANQEGLEEFEDFFEEVYEELAKFGSLEEMHVCDNLGEHMIGNVYAKYSDEEEADEALQALNGRFYAGAALVVEFSPVTDFREARCRQYDEGQCTYGPYCNFLHVKRISRSLRRDLEKRHRKGGKEGEGEEEGRGRSRSRSKRRSRSRSGERRERKEGEEEENGGEGEGMEEGDNDEGGKGNKENEGGEGEGGEGEGAAPVVEAVVEEGEGEKAVVEEEKPEAEAEVAEGGGDDE